MGIEFELGGVHCNNLLKTVLVGSVLRPWPATCIVCYKESKNKHFFHSVSPVYTYTYLSNLRGVGNC